jgi:hypothetical protein
LRKRVLLPQQTSPFSQWLAVDRDRRGGTALNPERDGGESEAAVSKERPDAYLEDGGEAAR